MSVYRNVGRIFCWGGSLTVFVWQVPSVFITAYRCEFKITASASQIENKMTSCPRFFIDSIIYSSETTIAFHLLTIAKRYIQRELKRSIEKIIFVFFMKLWATSCRLTFGLLFPLSHIQFYSVDVHSSTPIPTFPFPAFIIYSQSQIIMNIGSFIFRLAFD